MAVKRSVVSMTGGAETRGQDLLHNRNFTLLSIGQAISNMGDFIYSTTLLIWVAALGGSAAAVSGVLAAQYVPIFLLGPIAGVFVDRWHRLRTMIVSDLARALLALLPLCAPEALRLPSIYGSVFLISAISRFFMPARSAVTQVIVTREQQAQAASVGQVTQALSVIVGPGLASPLYFAVGPVVAILVNAASFVLSALCLWYMRVPKANLLPAAFESQTGSLEQVETSRGIRAIFDEMLAGFGLVLKTRLLLLVTILGMIAMFGAGAINSLPGGWRHPDVRVRHLWLADPADNGSGCRGSGCCWPGGAARACQGVTWRRRNVVVSLLLSWLILCSTIVVYRWCQIF
jgi:MFS family permease